MLFQPINKALLLRRSLLLLSMLFLSALSLEVSSQSSSYTRLNNELRFSHSIDQKWSTEIDFAGAFSSTPNEERVLKTNTQRMARILGHYQLSPRWKLSSYTSYHRNKDVPDLGLYKFTEWRFGLQGVYYFNKLGYTLSTRIRTEIRHIWNMEGENENIYRYRQQLKFQKPINSQMLRQGVFYMLVSEEITFKSSSMIIGLDHFDRNRFKIGGGYLITANLQFELAYQNQFLPRDNGNIIYNGISIIVTTNNFLGNIKNRNSNKPGESQ